MTFWFSSCGGVESFLHGGGCSASTSVTPSTMEMSATLTSRDKIAIQSKGNVVIIADDDDDGENDSVEMPYSQDPHTTKSSTQTWLLSVASELSRKAVIVSPRGRANELSAAIQKDYHPLQSAVEIVPVRQTSFVNKNYHICRQCQFNHLLCIYPHSGSSLLCGIFTHTSKTSNPSWQTIVLFSN
jgi:hypothetical protein